MDVEALAQIIKEVVAREVAREFAPVAEVIRGLTERIGALELEREGMERSIAELLSPGKGSDLADARAGER